MKKLLVLNGSHSDVPLIEAGKKLGFYVVTTGNDSSLIGHTYSDEYHKADFSDKQEVLCLAKRLNIDAICSCANDFGAITASYVAEKMGLPGHDSYETTLTLHHKHRFKQFALANNISTPFARNFSSAEEGEAELFKFKFPLLIKPVDLTGGKGVTKITSIDEYAKAVEYALSTSRTNLFLIEEFIQGTYHSFTTFVLDGKIAFFFSDNEYSFLNPYLVTTSAAPATDIEKVCSQLIEESERIIELLSLCNGVFHIQYILNEEKAWIIEITRRCSGDFYPYPVNYAPGLDWAQWIVKAESGMDCGDFQRLEQQGFFGRHCIMSRRNGIIKRVIIDSLIATNIIAEFNILKIGDFIDNYMVNKYSIIFLRYGTMEEMILKTTYINTLVSLEVE